jgi:hypothetical protein
MTWCAAASFLTVSGVAATRVSPGRVSAGIPIFMNAPTVDDEMVWQCSCSDDKGGLSIDFYLI